MRHGFCAVAQGLVMAPDLRKHPPVRSVEEIRTIWYQICFVP